MSKIKIPSAKKTAKIMGFKGKEVDKVVKFAKKTIKNKFEFVVTCGDRNKDGLMCTLEPNHEGKHLCNIRVTWKPKKIKS